MKTLILYATKYGAAREIAERIAKKIEGSEVHDLKKGGIPSLDQYDCVIIGGSVYAGTLLKEAKAYAADNADALLKKKFGLFVCGFDDSREKAYFESNFALDVLQKAKAKSFLGGVFDPKKVGFFERLILKIVAKQSEYLNNIRDDEIGRFADIMKS